MHIGSAILENGWQYFILSLGTVMESRTPDKIEFHTGDAQNANGDLLPVCQSHVAQTAADRQSDFQWLSVGNVDS